MGESVVVVAKKVFSAGVASLLKGSVSVLGGVGVVRGIVIAVSSLWWEVEREDGWHQPVLVRISSTSQSSISLPSSSSSLLPEEEEEYSSSRNFRQMSLYVRTPRRLRLPVPTTLIS